MHYIYVYIRNIVIKGHLLKNINSALFQNPKPMAQI